MRSAVAEINVLTVYWAQYFSVYCAHSILCSHRECKERRPVSQVAVSDSRGGIFSAFVDFCRCRIGLETQNGAILCSHRECKERRPVSQVAFSDSRGGIFSAFVGLCGYRICLETQNGARMRSAVVEKIGDQGRYRCRHIAKDRLQCSTVFLATIDAFWVLFRVFGPIQHAWSPAIAKNISRHESETAIFRVPLLSQWCQIISEILNYLSNCWPLSSSVSWFCTNSTPVNMG